MRAWGRGVTSLLALGLTVAPTRVHARTALDEARPSEVSTAISDERTDEAEASDDEASGAAEASPPCATARPDRVRSSPPPPAVRSERPTRRLPLCSAEHRWGCCSTPVGPCIRSRPARALLLSLGVLAGGGAAGLLFLLGDRLDGGDPATFMVGAGVLAGVAALTGTVAGRLGADKPGDPDRVRPSTIGLEYAYPGASNLDESKGHGMALTFAPTYRFSGDDGRLRLIGHVGGLLNREIDVDPRPQFDEAIEGQDGTSPRVVTERELSVGLGLDLAVLLPYPLSRRSAYLGPVELRYKPEVQIRREVFDPRGHPDRVLERTMLLPLTAGVRWHLSWRQRFTVYLGPRFDFLAYAEPGDDTLERGGAEVGPLYGEAWYDLDVPFTLRPRLDGGPRRAAVNGMFSVGYVHSRFDGYGFNFGRVVGFLGPVHLAWWTRVRPRGWPVALQGGVRTVIGNGYALVFHGGVVLPDITRRRG